MFPKEVCKEYFLQNLTVIGEERINGSIARRKYKVGRIPRH